MSLFALGSERLPVRWRPHPFDAWKMAAKGLICRNDLLFLYLQEETIWRQHRSLTGVI